jgi:hypothetical protein
LNNISVDFHTGGRAGIWYLGFELMPLALSRVP